jgi:hypothetical protein
LPRSSRAASCKARATPVHSRHSSRRRTGARSI